MFEHLFPSDFPTISTSPSFFNVQKTQGQTADTPGFAMVFFAKTLGSHDVTRLDQPTMDGVSWS